MQHVRIIHVENIILPNENSVNLDNGLCSGKPICSYKDGAWKILQRDERLCLYRKPPLSSPHSPYSRLPFILPGRLPPSSLSPSTTSPLSRPKHPRPAPTQSISPPPLDPRLPPFKATQPPHNDASASPPKMGPATPLRPKIPPPNPPPPRPHRHPLHPHRPPAPASPAQRPRIPAAGLPRGGTPHPGRRLPDPRQPAAGLHLLGDGRGARQHGLG